MELSKTQIRVLFVNYFKDNLNAVETSRKIYEIWGKDTTNKRTLQFWFTKFKAGDFSLEDEPRSGRPTVIQDDILRGSVEADPAKTTRQIPQVMHVNQKTVVQHLSIIGKVKKLDKWVPADLTDRHKIQWCYVSYALLLRNRNEPFLERIVTFDEK